MKKIICVILAIMLFAMLTACGCSTDANVEGSTGNDAGNNGRMYNNDTYDGSGNNGAMQGGASAEFDIYGGNSGNGNSGNGRTTGTTGTASRKTASYETGELHELASLIGANDFKVIEKLGEGNADTIIKGNTAIVKRRTYSLPIYGKSEPVILNYGAKGLIDNIEISPDRFPVIWSMNISREYGSADKVSTNGLDYNYYSVWSDDSVKIELVCWNKKMSVTITGK